MPRHLAAHRDLIWQLMWREVGQRYQGSFLGILWSFLMPLLMIGIYTLVFSVLFPSQWPADPAMTQGGVVLTYPAATTQQVAVAANAHDLGTATGSFALIVFSGLIPFGVFSDVTSRAPALILAVPNYVKRVVFPLEILPVVALGSAVVNALIATLILLAGSLLFLKTITPWIVLLPLAFVPLILLSLGIGWGLAALGVYVRDMGHLIGFIVQIAMYLSPVFYPITNLSRLPVPLQKLLLLNPMVLILKWFRLSLLGMGTVSLRGWAAWVCVTAVFACLGYLFFMKTKSGFADVI